MRNRAGLETRGKILSATRRSLAERGLEGTTIKAICDEAGIRAGSFYNLFDSKEQVVLSVIGEAITAVDPDPENQGTDHLSDLVEAYIRFVQDEPIMARVYLTIAVTGSLKDSGIAGRVLRHHQARAARFGSAMQRDRPQLTESDAIALTEALLAALNGYALHSQLDPSFDFAGHARRLLTMEPVK